MHGTVATRPAEQGMGKCADCAARQRGMQTSRSERGVGAATPAGAAGGYSHHAGIVCYDCQPQSAAASGPPGTFSIKETHMKVGYIGLGIMGRACGQSAAPAIRYRFMPVARKAPPNWSPRARVYASPAELAREVEIVISNVWIPRTWKKSYWVNTA